MSRTCKLSMIVQYLPELPMINPYILWKKKEWKKKKPGFPSKIITCSQQSIESSDLRQTKTGPGLSLGGGSPGDRNRPRLTPDHPNMGILKKPNPPTPAVSRGSASEEALLATRCQKGRRVCAERKPAPGGHEQGGSWQCRNAGKVKVWS